MAAQVKVFEDAEADQRGEALSVGRNLMEAHVAVIDMDGVHRIAAVQIEIG